MQSPLDKPAAHRAPHQPRLHHGCANLSRAPLCDRWCAKRDMIRNVVDLFTQVGLGTQRVAILSAVETVTDAAQLGPLRDRRFALGDRQQRDRGAGALTGSRQAT